MVPERPNASSPGGRLPVNILVFCIDQWDARMEIPEGVVLPGLEELRRRGVQVTNQYCTAPACTPSRASMWTGRHPQQTGLWDLTNFAWVTSMSPDVPTIGGLLRELGYYTAFKGKWHLSHGLPNREDALEPYGFGDFQVWGDPQGGPLEGATHDAAIAFETADWLRLKRPADRPWMLVCSLVNPHDIQFYQADEVEQPVPAGTAYGKQTRAQTLGLFDAGGPGLPANFDDDLSQLPLGPHSYKEFTESNYGAIPPQRTDVWLSRRRYLLNCFRLVDAQIKAVLDEVDRQGLWESTMVVLVSDHGEMDGAHGLAQKGGIAFDEAAAALCVIAHPDGVKGAVTGAVGSHVDLVPTFLGAAGVTDDELRNRYPDLPGRSLLPLVVDPEHALGRGTADHPGRGALITWDGLHMLDPGWAAAGAVAACAGIPEAKKTAAVCAALARFGPPDFDRRTFFRTIVDGRYKLVRWFAPSSYGSPAGLDEASGTSDFELHDLVADPGELQNLADPRHRRYDRSLVESMLAKLNDLVARELGADLPPAGLSDVRALAQAGADRSTRH